MNQQIAKEQYANADALFRRGAFDEALAILSSLDAAFPDDEKILYARARCLAALGRGDEARAICTRLVDLHPSPRAKALLARLDGGVPPESSAGGDDARPSSSPARRRRRTMALLAFAVLAAAGLAAALLLVLNGDGDGTELATASQPPALHAEDEDVNRRIEKPLATGPPGNQSPGVEASSEKAAPSANRATRRLPGQVHPRHEWRPRALEGQYDWEPGIYRRVPCINDPKHTISVYLPLAYGSDSAVRLPVLFIQMASGNPGFLGLESWAEERHVILIAINESKNHPVNYLQRNSAAQDDALETIVPTMRIDLGLCFAVGMSGGAKSSWHMVWRYPQHFAGIVMMGMNCDDGYHMLSPHVRIAYLHGDRDFNNDGIAHVIPLVQANGNPVRETVFPGGHVPGNTEQIAELLDWMLSDSRSERGIPSPSE